MQQKRMVIIGATSSIAVHCSRLWLNEKPMECLLIGREQVRTEDVATDLRLRSPQSTVRTMTTDFLDPRAIATTVQSIIDEGPIDLILIAHGTLPDQQACENNLTMCQETLLINGTSPVLFAEAFAKHLEKANKGTLILISSVAGERGRKSNYVYGAAKSMVTTYAEGLQHRFAKSNVKIILVKPGPTDTPMTSHLQNKGMKLARVEDVTKTIVVSIDRGQTIIYAPKLWRIIMHIIRILPRSIFNRLPI